MVVAEVVPRRSQLEMAVAQVVPVRSQLVVPCVFVFAL